ncbi:MAG TPA: chloride channel protein, partial [Sedimentisphaerales bacterium]|nr:chloride channel protein [Sedimentisphaerales bacterium]
GAAAGIASIFNAPIAGVLFALEVFLRDVSFRTFSPVLVSAVISSVMTRGLLGKHDVMFPLVSDIEYIFHWYELGNYVVLGVITALIGVVFIKALYATDDLFGRLRVHNILKPVIGAMLLGVTGIAIAYLSGGGVPVIFGQGYSFIGRCIGGSSDAVASYFVSSIWMLALVVALKIVATCLTLGSGGSGGAFAPSLFIGAATGYAFGMAMEMTGLFPTIHLQTYAIVGMAAVVAATNHAVLAATVIVFELTRNYNIILPAMFASTISVAGVKFLIRDSIHTMKLRREGINFASRAGRAILQRLTVAKVMHREFSVVRDSMSLNDVISKAESTELSDFIVVDAQNRYLGMLLAKNLHEVLVHRESAALLLVSEVVDTSIPPVTLDETPDTVFDKFSLHNSDTMPVLTQENSTTFAGMVTRAAVMKSQQEEMDSAA